MRLIDADELEEAMYRSTFEEDSDLQKWDGGCWIRYKLFENVIEKMPTIKQNEWHDLMKDPMDLPLSEGEYLILQKDGQHKIGSYARKLSSVGIFENHPGFYMYFPEWGNDEIPNVVAWMEIPGKIYRRTQMTKVTATFDEVQTVQYFDTWKAAETAEKYRIHDLRENPEDLPEELENVLIYIRAEATGEALAFVGCLVFSNGEIFEPYKANLLGWARFPSWEDEG